MKGPVRPNRFVVASGEELHAAVLQGGVFDREPTRGGAAVVGLDPVGLVLVPVKHGFGFVRALGEKLIEVDRHSFAAQLLGNRLGAEFEHVALPLRGSSGAGA